MTTFRLRLRGVHRLLRGLDGTLRLLIINRWYRLRMKGVKQARVEQLELKARASAEASVRQNFGSMKGVVMKLGQMASYLTPDVPEVLRQALSQLQINAEPMGFDLCRSIIEQSLGAPLNSLFLTFDEIPFASASIGQVHRATTIDGQDVTVKVQYLGISETIRADLSNTVAVTGLLRMMFPAMDTSEMADELKTRILEELDYLHELQVQQTFFNYYRDHPFIVIPQPLPALSSATVLTSTYIEGATFEQALAFGEDHRNRIGETIFRFVFRSLYQMHSFNGDPHPGNYRFLPDGRVAFLDFGFSKTFSSSEIAIFESLVRHMAVDRDPEIFKQQIIASGLLRNAEDVPSKEIMNYFGIYYDIVAEDKIQRVTPEFARDVLRHSFSRDHPLKNYVNVPKSFVVIQRINLGMYAILAELGATANWRRIAMEIWPFTQSEPSTPLGTLEARWKTHRDG